ncbi:MAG: DegT/DnrJ/EryC1/StrS aminotransferase family protein [Marinilabiliaceae bacterium]|nr:DegT/DnrJ/EryC1/StrS aminotransferase family protein [Marinilabiliaceae bacterium]
MYIPYSKVQLAGNETKYLKEVLDSGWLTTSSKPQHFENLLASFVGARYAYVVSSCAAALHLAVEAIGITEGDRIKVPIRLASF